MATTTDDSLKTSWEKTLASETDRMTASHNDRNQDPILQKLIQHWPLFNMETNPLRCRTKVLEVGSGTGQHAFYMHKRLACVDWQPTDFDEKCIRSTNAWTAVTRHEMSVSEASSESIVRECVMLDATWPTWPFPENSFDVIYNCNTVHIAPIGVLFGLAKGAKTMLRSGGRLFLYGPFMIGGKHTSESNASFDAGLRQRDPSWGIRSIEETSCVMKDNGLRHLNIVTMPANNLLLIYEKI